MPKGYWIAHVDANNEASFTSDSYKAYVEGAGPAFSKYDATFLARGGAFHLAEGQNMGARHVVVEFPSLEQAKNCYDSPEYSEAKKHRMAVANANIVLVEGI